MTPTRIQLKRTKGWRMPANTVKVTRGTGMKWGNPFRVNGCTVSDSNGMEWTYATPDEAATAAVVAFRNWLAALDYLCPSDHRTRRNIRKELRGKNLACWCKLCEDHKNGKPFGVQCAACATCHSDVLGEMSNA